MSMTKKSITARIAKKVIFLLFPHGKGETIHDDLEEGYSRMVVEGSVFRARIWYIVQMITIVRGKLYNGLYWSVPMFMNYIKIVFRNIKNHKGYSFINIMGLALGIASCILILSYVGYELSFDKHHQNAHRIYRVVARGDISGDANNNAKIGAALAPFLMTDYPEIESTVRFATEIFNMFRYEDKKFYESTFFYADASVFNVFSYSLVKGDDRTALEAPNTVVLTQETALKYFGNEDPMGKIIRFNDEVDLTVTGIMKNPPANTHLPFDLLLSFGTFQEYSSYVANSKTIPSCYTYILLKEGTDVGDFETKCVDSFNRHIGDYNRSRGGGQSCSIQPLTSIHLHSRLQNDNPGNSSIMYVVTFTILAALILLVASINYVNLTTARSATRAKEVGMRKVLGAFKGEIARQFIGESFFHGLIASLVGVALVMAALPLFRDFTSNNMSAHVLRAPVFWLEVIAILFLTCFLAGGYPAIFLSRFKPARTLKGIFVKGMESSRFRNILVVFQFVVLIALIIMTVGIFSQMSYVRNRNLGFDKEQLLYIKFHNDHSDNDNRIHWINSIKAELVSLDGVVNAALSGHVPGTRYYQRQFFPEEFPENQSLTMETYNIDDDFLDTYGIKIMKGRNFSKEIMSDAEDAAIINQTAAKQLGWMNPVGKTLMIKMGHDETKKYHIIGVAQDFHSKSLHHVIEPLVFKKFADFHSLTVRLKPENIQHTMNLIQDIWNEFELDHPFEYFFLDEIVDGLYKTEAELGRIIRMFTFLAICIGCLGLFGLVSFMTEQRTKEIGIRKTVGASRVDIAVLLLKGFTKWIILANLFAWPVAYYAMNQWLQTFAYRITPGIWMFVLGAGVSFTVAILTMGYRFVRAASANPVDSLRYE